MCPEIIKSRYENRSYFYPSHMEHQYRLHHRRGMTTHGKDIGRNLHPEFELHSQILNGHHCGDSKDPLHVLCHLNLASKLCLDPRHEP